MKKSLISSHSLSTFPSPGAGNYQEMGWRSKRVPHPSENSRRHISALTPFYSDRTMPSKWEDAERWICSPVLVTKDSQCQPQRLPKSKSGPIVPPGIAYYSHYLPSMQVLDNASVRNFIANSPFSTRVLMPTGVGVHYNEGGIGGQAIVARSDLTSECSSPSSHGPAMTCHPCKTRREPLQSVAFATQLLWMRFTEKFAFSNKKLDNINDAEDAITRVISKRDMATQMSPEGSTCSSPRGRSSSPPSVPLEQSESDHPAKLEIREAQEDKRATLISRTTRHGPCITRKGRPGVQEVDKNATDAHISSWDFAEASSDFSKLQREEAKITAWENLQNAKAEEAIRKLEMKLEKKRSSSMDKILNKLRMAQIKAQEMRSSISDTQGHQIPKISRKISFFRRHAWLNFLSSCFTSHKS